ncbi:DUF2971 domain-containing protein [Microbacterium deminutum]|uniref:DUF2971 domain-containing protein n=1 Tax=Microbacterium deminutum TaxID=344164 RepID=UPI0031D6ABAC
MYHYTDAAGMSGILQSNQLWATSATALNDSSEVKHGFEVCRVALQMWDEPDPLIRAVVGHLIDQASATQDLVDNTYIVSASSSSYLMNQWTGYAQSSGYCLTIRADVAFAPAGSEGRLASSEWVRVLYDSRSQHRMAQRLFGQLPGLASKDALRAITSLAAVLKHHAFAAEDEWRLIASLESRGHPNFRIRGNQIVPYVELRPAARETGEALFPSDEVAPVPVDQITVGPPTGMSAERRMNGLRRYLAARGLGTIPIENSEIPYVSD